MSTDAPAKPVTWLSRIRGNHVIQACVWVLIALGLATVWPHALGGKIEWVVVSGQSMEPTFHTGDLVIVADTGSWQIGDTVLYAVASPSGNGPGYNVIHRLVAGNAQDGWSAQGDNKPRPDPWVIKDSAIQGEEVFMIPQVGNLITRFRTGPFLALLAGALVTAAILVSPEATKKTTGTPNDQPAKSKRRWRRRKNVAIEQEFDPSI